MSASLQANIPLLELEVGFIKTTYLVFLRLLIQNIAITSTSAKHLRLSIVHPSRPFEPLFAATLDYLSWTVRIREYVDLAPGVIHRSWSV